MNENYPHLAIEETRVSAMAGTHVEVAIREAAIFALQQRHPVRLVHNETSYVIDPSNILVWIANGAEDQDILDK